MRNILSHCLSPARAVTALFFAGMLAGLAQTAPTNSAPAAAQPTPEELTALNNGLKNLIIQSDPGAQEIFAKYPAFNPIANPPAFAAGGAGAAGAPGGRGAATPQYPPMGNTITDAQRATLQTSLDQLSAQLAALKKQYAGQPLYDRIADVEVYYEAVRRPLLYGEKITAAAAQPALTTGLARAADLANGQTPWMLQTGVRGYYSKIDGSAQPYLLTMPQNYSPANNWKYQLDIFLHGRDDTNLELDFFRKGTSYNGKPLNPGPDRFLLQPYARYTNAMRFAGEVDVLEAIASVKKAYAIDENKLVMTGFSMGGAGAWQFTVHYPDLWAATSAGAGFTETAQFDAGDLRRTPATPIQQNFLWHMYDSRDWAINAFDTHLVGYSSASDPQKQAGDTMNAAMTAEGLTMEYVIGIGAMPAHNYTPEAIRTISTRLDALVAAGRDPAPKEIRFTTWMLRYNKAYWLSVEGMGQQWVRARANAKIDGDQINLTTTNVTALRLNFDPGLAPFAAGSNPTLSIDGTTLALPAVGADKSLRASLVKTGDYWALGELPADELHKSPGLQGPIDDAFMDSFMFVGPTGTPLNPAVGQWEKDQLAYAISQWRGFFRGDPRVKNDSDITDADIAAHNLVLFGDPSSNAILKRIADKLPIQWTADGVVVGSQKFPSAVNVPVLIYPNPLNPKKYVVINSGFTFHDQANNSMQYPQLPDWAVVNITERGSTRLPLSVQAQGFFDESWKLSAHAPGA